MKLDILKVGAAVFAVWVTDRARRRAFRDGHPEHQRRVVATLVASGNWDRWEDLHV